MARILSVSYDASLLLTRRMLLEKAGYDVVSTENLERALALCRAEECPDLLIIGHSMPHADKAAIVNRLRAVCKTPVLALRKITEPRFEAAEYEADPFRPEQLLELVKEIVDNPKGAKPQQ